MQETGRAGRDGEASSAVLYVSPADMQWCQKVAKGSDREKIGHMVEYATEVRCRRATLLGHFDEKYGKCNEGHDELCDVCADAGAVRKAMAAAEDWRTKLVRS